MSDTFDDPKDEFEKVQKIPCWRKTQSTTITTNKQDQLKQDLVRTLLRSGSIKRPLKLIAEKVDSTQALREGGVNVISKDSKTRPNLAYNIDPSPSELFQGHVH